MDSLSSEQMLETWECGRDLHAVDRAIVLLGAAFPAVPFDQLADLSIGQRDAALLRLRCATFGPSLAGIAECPRCGERLEFVLEGSGLVLQESDASPTAETVQTRAGLRFRLPTSRDVAHVVGERDAALASQRLSERCLVGGDGTFACSGEALAEVESLMSEADPQADVRFDFVCEGCGNGWEAPFDVVDFFWAEIESRAMRLQADVHLLASAYAWSEHDILAMGEARRASYIEMVEG